MYMKQRQKKELLEKYKKEREKLKKTQEKQMKNFTKTEKLRLSNSVRPASPKKRGEEIRDRFSHAQENSGPYVTNRTSNIQRSSSGSKGSHNVILNEKLRDAENQPLEIMPSQRISKDLHDQ